MIYLWKTIIYLWKIVFHLLQISSNELDLSEAKLFVAVNFDVSDIHSNIVLCDTFVYD